VITNPAVAGIDAPHCFNPLADPIQVERVWKVDLLFGDTQLWVELVEPDMPD
jgi:hypothetical protein